MTSIFTLVNNAIHSDPHRWHSLVGIDTVAVANGGQHCPFGCNGAGTDRLYAVPSFKVDGAVCCRTEGNKVYDAFVAAGKATSRYDAAKQLAVLYGVEVPQSKTKDHYIPKPKLQPYNADLVSPWLTAKGVTEDTFIAAGGSLIRYMNETYIGFPAFAPDDLMQPARYILYDLQGQQVKFKGGTVPSKCIKVTPDAPKALVGIGLRNLPDVEVIIKVEGVTDTLKLWDSIPTADKSRYAVFTNANGCTENPTPESGELVHGKVVIIVGDADKAGQAGTVKWATAFAQVAREVRKVELPYPIRDTHGKDVRDYFNEGNTFADFLKLVANAPVIVKVAGSKTQKSQQTKAKVSVANAGQLNPSGEIILDTERTLPSAEAFIRMHYTIDGVQTIYFLNGEFYTWRNNAYKPIDEVFLKGEMLRFLHGAVTESKAKNGDIYYEPFPANDTHVNKVINALEGHVFLSKEIPVPHWLENDQPPVSDLSMVICFKTENLDLTTMRTFAPTPKLFNFSSLDFNYDPSALCPEWDKFLDQLWGNDTESKETLMMFIGLMLVPITKFHKALFIIGVRRAGKGTIIRVSQKLIGKLNYCAPTAEEFTKPFGLQSFIGKTAAFISDVRFDGTRISTVIERILNITGEDEMTIDRKYLSAVTTRLLTRLMLASNRVPRLSDESGALVGRFIFLKLTNSYYGKEDLDLQNKLFQELPGIFNRAVAGLKSLLKQGYFKQPESARGVMESMENLSSAVGLFVKECCNIGEGLFASSDELWDAWHDWGQLEGMSERAIGTREMFFEKLNALGIPDLVASRPVASTGVRIRGYKGIELIKNQRPKVSDAKQIMELMELVKK